MMSSMLVAANRPIACITGEMKSITCLLSGMEGPCLTSAVQSFGCGGIRAGREPARRPWWQVVGSEVARYSVGSGRGSGASSAPKTKTTTPVVTKASARLKVGNHPVCR